MLSETLIFGDGHSALLTAEQLLQTGRPVILINPHNRYISPDQALIDRITSYEPEMLLKSCLTVCRGQSGDFNITVEQDGQARQYRAAHIVIATDANRRSNLHLYGLAPSASVLPLSSFYDCIEEQAANQQPLTIAFVNGVAEENSPVIFEEMVRCALRARRTVDARCCFLTANLKVAGNGLEALQREAKTAGVSFFKLDRGAADLRLDQNDNQVQIEFDDSITGRTFTLSPHMIVIDETIVPSPYVDRLSGLLQLHTDPDGFLQTENVHRLAVETNRKGILAVGSARGAMTDDASDVDAFAAAAAISGLPQPSTSSQLAAAEIDTGACIRCLTCYRLCPHAAVEKQARMTVSESACESCGLCIAECPRQAIAPKGAIPEPGAYRMAAASNVEGSKLVVFGCRQSAIPALVTARERSLHLPAGLSVIDVPCVGGVSLQQILEVYKAGAMGVLVMGCHSGNCYSEIGSDCCRNRIDVFAQQLPAMGISANRLVMQTVAANMAVEAANIVNVFADEMNKD